LTEYSRALTVQLYKLMYLYNYGSVFQNRAAKPAIVRYGGFPLSIVIIAFVMNVRNLNFPFFSYKRSETMMECSA